MHTLQFDGMLQTMKQNPGRIGLLGYGWLIQRNGIEIAHGFGIFVKSGVLGSNVAEYLSLIEGLEALADLEIRDEAIEIRGDAKCVIDQMKGDASVSSSITRKLSQRARHLLRRFTSPTWVWVPRGLNKQADALSRRGLRYLHCSSTGKSWGEVQKIPFHGEVLIPVVNLRVHSKANR
jgi:ribonuclease HI